MAVSNQFLVHLEDLHRKQNSANVTWLSDYQQQAWESYLSQSIPTAKLESWKYTGIHRYLEGKHWDSVFVEQKELQDNVSCVLFAQQSNTVIFCPDGQVRINAVDTKISVKTTQELTIQEQSDWLSWLQQQTYFKEDGLNALNMALSSTCVFIEVQAEANIELPLQLTTVLDNEENTRSTHLVNKRVFIKINQGAKLKLREILSGKLNSNIVSNQVSQITLSERAHLEHTVVAAYAELIAGVSKHQVIGFDKSDYTLNLLSAGGLLNRQEFHVCLKGSQAKATLQGVLAGSQKNKLDVQVLIEHQADHTFSSQYFNGLLNEQAQGIFNGRVHVKPRLVKVVSEQVNNNLLLSDDAQMNTKPELVIHTDEVKCTHGATVGRLDDNALFYLQSRGLSRYQAQELLTQAFIQSVLDKMSLSNEQSNQALSMMTQAINLK